MLVLAPSNSTSQHNADLNASVWKSEGRVERELHWVRKVANERSTVVSQAIHERFAQPPGRLHILGLENAGDDVYSFFKDEIMANSLGDPHALLLKARILLELSRLSLLPKPPSWKSSNDNEATRALEDREFQKLSVLTTDQAPAPTK